MSEIEILNYAQLNFIQNAIYMLGFVGLIFITFRLIRYQRENNANMLGKIFCYNFRIMFSLLWI